LLRQLREMLFMETGPWTDHRFDRPRPSWTELNVLATKYGSSFSCDGVAALRALGDHYDMLSAHGDCRPDFDHGRLFK
jgi:hypothetical protein